MKIGSLVIYGWTYRIKKILSNSSRAGIIISDEPEMQWTEVDRLQCRNGKWSITTIEEDEWVVSVLWPNGNITKAPVTNLVEV